MGLVRKANKVKLVVGMISNDPNLLLRLEKTLEWRFGPIDFRTALLDFAYTDYYEPEMGSNLKRQFVSFRRLIDPERLPDIKLYTNKVELQNSVARNRPSRKVNMDPGYLTEGKLVLATTKDQQHRMFLNKGIYAEVTLRYVEKTFLPWDWTYSDYKTKEYIDIFNEIRRIYTQQIK
ncbi:MAG: DUF4416 family protein [Candidatus Omnitrophota bacterium]|nr:DUF4416 family protein [Candidatus Omnitrophota bacterium]